MKWACGITTVPERSEVLFPATLKSVQEAGFENITLFIDRCEDPSIYDKYELPYVCHTVNVRTTGNWMAGLWNLYVTNPFADMYAMFQDDFVICKGARKYIERCTFPEKSYLNLLTFRENHRLIGGKEIGWHESDQLGKGAVALVFSQFAVKNLLMNRHMTRWVGFRHKGHRLVDRAISQSFRKSGFKEFIHNPSLIQHMGLVSSMGSDRHPQSTCFRGEEFSAMEFLK